MVITTRRGIVAEVNCGVKRAAEEVLRPDKSSKEQMQQRGERQWKCRKGERSQRAQPHGLWKAGGKRLQAPA